MISLDILRTQYTIFLKRSFGIVHTEWAYTSLYVSEYPTLEWKDGER